MEKITADEAAQLIQDGDAILISGSGGGASSSQVFIVSSPLFLRECAEPQ